MDNLYDAYYNLVQRGGKIDEKVNRMSGRGQPAIVNPVYEPQGSQNTILTPQQRAMTEAQIRQSIEAQKAAPSYQEELKAAAEIDRARQLEAQRAYELYLQEQAKQQANKPQGGIFNRLFGN